MSQASSKVKFEPGIQTIINLPDLVTDPPLPKIIVQRLNRVQWRYKEKFSVSITPADVFDQNQLESHVQPDGTFLTDVAIVIGKGGSIATCTYTQPRLGDENIEKLPPPPNTIIVDSSIPTLDKLKQKVLDAIVEIFANPAY